MTAPQEAEKCITKATELQEAGDDKKALHFAEKALRMWPGYVAAQEMIEYIQKWGADSEAAQAVKEVLEARDYYAVMGLGRCEVVEEKTLRKIYLQKSRLLHPVRCDAWAQ